MKSKSIFGNFLDISKQLKYEIGQERIKRHLSDKDNKFYIPDNENVLFKDLL